MKETMTPYIELKNIDRVFGVTKALDQMSLKLFPGQVIGLIGSNGAGKSTLMKILTGVLEQTAGEIIVEGKTIEKKDYNAKKAQEFGISCAYQDLSLCTNLSVYENFAVMNEEHSLFGKPGWRKRAAKETKEKLEKYFPANGIDVYTPMDQLSLAEQQVVEITKAVMDENLKVLVLDEPTSALSSDRAAQLQKVVKEQKKKGISIIYISHKLEEILQVSDVVVAMNSGCKTGEFLAEEVSVSDLVNIMGGSAKGGQEDRKKDVVGEDSVQIQNLNTEELHNINIHVKKGEIVGISGLVGSGQTSLLNEIYDSMGRKGKSRKGAVNTYGKIAYVSGDRANEGVFSLWNIRDNILIANLDQVKTRGFLDAKKEKKIAEEWYEKLKFRAEGITSKITSLSGGNQQKALIARGIASGADIILLNDPTAGVDIETKQEIYELLNEARNMGKSIIFYSTEDNEMEVCDRVYVMSHGEIAEELKGSDITVSNVVKASFKNQGKEKNNEEDKKNKSVVSALLRHRATLPLLILVILLFANAYYKPLLLSYNGLDMMIATALPLVFVSLSQMFMVVSGDIDMGNGRAIALVNVISAVVLSGSFGLGILGLVLFIAAYLFMAFLIHVRKMPAIVVTLGTQYIWYGIALVMAPTPGGMCPQWISGLFNYRFPLIPMPVVWCFIAGIVSYWILKKSKYGMILRGIGNNPQSIQRAGWSYLAAKMTNYGIAAVLIIFAGLSVTSISLGADASSCGAYQMMSIAVIILGGCELSGGQVEPVGVVAAAVAMSFITTLLTSLKIDSNYQTAVIGLILILTLTAKLLTHKKGGAGR